MELAAEYEQDEFCPSCGKHSRLVEDTGWCASCTLEHDPSLKQCTTCGDFFPKKAQVSQCWTCRREAWFTRHADKIEEYLASGYSLTAAVKAVADSIRPNCTNCGESIRGGRETSRFCRKNAECAKKADDYTALKATGLAPDVALAIAVGRVTVISSN